MKKILSVLLFAVLAFAANAQLDGGAGPLVICGEGEACPPDPNGHFSNGVVPHAPDVNSEYFPTIRTCEPLDVCITMHCPASINLSAVGLGNGSINLRGIQVKGFGGLPEGVTYCLSDENWEPDGYYSLHLTGIPAEAGTYQLKLSAVLQGSILSVNTDTFFPNGMDAVAVTVVEGSAPVAGFTADATEITAGTAVNFTNTSTGYQATRTWTFEGGNPATSNEENPRVIYS
ncbi:MAG: PKD domain-containing protein, partial [Bacteroidales bacterium]|nr:PKD domain-containing protein [Bacteroidales bacterium]